MDIGELDDYEEELDNNQKVVEENLENYSNLAKFEKAQLSKSIRKTLQEMNEAAKTYKRKIYTIPMPKAQEKTFLDKYEEYVNIINELKEQINQKEAEAASSSHEQDEEDLVFTNGKVDYNKNTSDQVIAHGKKIQGKGIDAAERMVGRIHDADEMANEQMKEMDRQEGVILEINSANMEIESDLKRAKKHITYFARTYMQDKLIIVLIFLCACAILGILIVSVVGDKKE